MGLWEKDQQTKESRQASVNGVAVSGRSNHSRAALAGDKKHAARVKAASIHPPPAHHHHHLHPLYHLVHAKKRIREKEKKNMARGC
jgi:hypothetical protein